MPDSEATRARPFSEFVGAIEHARKDIGEGNERDAMGRVLAAVARDYLRAREDGVAGAVFSDKTVTVTEVAVLASAMMDAVELEVFELAMWNSLGSV